jgi:hypothetical protein
MLAKHASQREWLRRAPRDDEYLEAARRWAKERAASPCRVRRRLPAAPRHAYPQDDLLALTLKERTRKPGTS